MSEEAEQEDWRSGPVRDQIVKIIKKYGPVTAAGIAQITDNAIARKNANQALRKGADAGVFEHLPAAPGTYLLTTSGQGASEDA